MGLKPINLKIEKYLETREHAVLTEEISHIHLQEKSLGSSYSSVEDKETIHLVLECLMSCHVCRSPEYTTDRDAVHFYAELSR